MSVLLKYVNARWIWITCVAVLPLQLAHAERAGVVGAVNTEAHGTPPGKTIREIVLGQEVLHNELIETDANGQAQVLMLDRTALTIGPNSSLVIDKFIYDPNTKSGEMSLTLRRGLMRFTGGALSKRKPVAVRTPVATVGIRGGMAVLQVVSPEQTNAGFLFGNEMTVEQDGGVVRRIARAGFGTSITGDGASRTQSMGRRPNASSYGSVTRQWRAKWWLREKGQWRAGQCRSQRSLAAARCGNPEPSH